MWGQPTNLSLRYNENVEYSR
ncbi:MAG: hypothetical protein DM484_22520 [Candidatus Methylumidiphilus alinenensis]|uniref:Uncharacterized protein n=1 Tax=Candidatus Methylumidiphilus alinenensis TaxID=2202197 RepID=A0A2W4QMY9_9GAMM|nr:MAG: hypothetical protein DM484_22520 [Candidatus Methylumidiphilus alinenensis]